MAEVGREVDLAVCFDDIASVGWLERMQRATRSLQVIAAAVVAAVVSKASGGSMWGFLIVRCGLSFDFEGGGFGFADYIFGGFLLLLGLRLGYG